MLWHGLTITFQQENGRGDGLLREWFSLLAAELSEQGLFETRNCGASCQPAPAAQSQAQQEEGGLQRLLQLYELVGGVLGVGIMQASFLAAHPGIHTNASHQT